MAQFFGEVEGVRAAMSERVDGDMLMTRAFNGDAEVIAHHKVFLTGQGMDPARAAYGVVCHGTRVATVENAQERYYPETDALVTATPDVSIGITVADCLPVVFYDPVARVAGVAHAGWRGVAAEIVPQTIAAMTTLGTQVENLLVEVGPGISQRHFAFDNEEAHEVFSAYAQFIATHQDTSGKAYIDLRAIVKEQLVSTGVLPEHLEISSACTYSDTAPDSSYQFFSARRHKGKDFKAMLAVVAMV